MTNTAVLREDLPNMTFSSYVHCTRKIKLIKFSNIYIYFIYKIRRCSGFKVLISKVCSMQAFLMKFKCPYNHSL